MLEHHEHPLTLSYGRHSHIYTEHRTHRELFRLLTSMFRHRLHEDRVELSLAVLMPNPVANEKPDAAAEQQKTNPHEDFHGGSVPRRAQ